MFIIMVQIHTREQCLGHMCYSLMQIRKNIEITNKTIIMENGDIVVLKDGTKIEQISIETFMRKPRESMRVIAK